MKFKHGDKISFCWNNKQYTGTIKWDDNELTYLVFGENVATYLYILKNNKYSNINIV